MKIFNQAPPYFSFQKKKTILVSLNPRSVLRASAQSDVCGCRTPGNPAGCLQTKVYPLYLCHEGLVDGFFGGVNRLPGAFPRESILPPATSRAIGALSTLLSR